MTAPSQAPGATAHALETSVQVALRIRPLVTDVRSLSRRVRPETEVLSLIERSATPSSISGSSTPIEPPQQVVVVPLQRHFTFDHIFGTDAAQEDIYQGCVKRMVDKFMEGYNVTIMAYGQTSSGKTYTMGTGAPSAEDRGSTSEGIIPRAMSQLFYEARRPPPVYPGFKVPALKTTFRVSFVEIYNEDLIDLLVKGDFRPPVSIREDAKGHIYWTGVQEIVVSSVEEVIHLLWFGSQNRQTHSTEMNEKSSRSHAIFSITLRQEKFIPTHPPPPQPISSDSQNNSPTFRRAHSKTPSISNTPLPINSNGSGSASSLLNGRPGTPTTGGSSIPAPFTSGIVAPGSKLKRQSVMPESASYLSLASQAINDDPEVEGEWVTLSSKFHFVDLAGSERLKRTSAIGDRAKEGISINAGLHALGNVISALGDPSKKASHVPYRDSKLTRLLQDSLGGNALALMIACVSPSEVNLGETLNTLKYANRARNIKNSSSLNQEINMENPEYLRSIIQKLKMEIKVLKAASLNSATSTPRPGITTDATGTPTAEQPKISLAHRLSTSSSVSGPVPGLLSGVDDLHNEDRALSPSPSRRLSHYQSRDSISTDVSHGYLDAVREEEDGYSSTSSSARTNVVGMPTPRASSDLATARHNLTPLTIPPSLDSKSFEAFVEPVIEEYEKVISGLETHLAMTQAALNHSELILEEQQGRLDVVEDENRTLLRKQTSLIREVSTPSPEQQQLQLELEQTLKKVQAQLDDAEARRAESERAIQDLESKLQAEQAKAQEHIQQLQQKEQQLQQEKEQQRAQSTTPTPLLPGLSTAAQEKEKELKAQADKIRQLEDQVRILKDQVEADADALRAAKTAKVVSTVEGHDGDETEETEETKREEELIEKLQSKASMELELEMEKSRHESLEAEVNAARMASQQSINDSISDHEVPPSQSVVIGEGDDVVRQLDVATHPPVSHSAAIAASAGDELIKKDLEEQLAAARESERQLKEEVVALTETLEKLQKNLAAAMEMEEMLHLAVSDLEGRLETSKETETKQLQELEQHLARIQDLETRSTKAEQEALQVVEELKAKLADAKVAADERLADELLELLEKMEQERSKVEALQTQVENQLVELAAEKSRAAEIEADRAAIQAQWETDKERISVLEKDIEEQSSHVLEKTALIATLETRLVTLEGSLSEKELLHRELSQKVADHDHVLGSKGTVIQELEDQISRLKSELEVSDKSTKDQVAAVQSELTVAQAQLVETQTRVQEQEQELLALREKTATLESAATTAAETLAAQGAEHAEAVKALESKVKLAEADRDEAETLLEEIERRHNAVDEQIKSLQNDVALHLTTIEILHGKLAQANNGSPPSSRPVSLSSSSNALAAGEDPAPIIQKLEKEKARYRALVRENEKEIERLSEDLESLASEFSNAATAFEDAEEEMKARITELEAIVEDQKPATGLGASLNNNLSTTSLASSIASSFSTRHREGATTTSASHPPSASAKAQVASLKAERDQALQSSEELSLIVADLNEKNHHLQERLLNLEREQESDKLNQVLERQAQQEEIRVLRERAERQDRNASPSPVGSHHYDDDLRSSVHDRILRHKTSTSSDAFGGAGLRGEDSLATPRQSWSTVASQQQQQPQGQAGSQVRAGRHESTLIQQAKHIKFLEERISELQASGGSPSLLADSRRGSLSSPAIVQAAGVGLGIHHKASDSDMTRSVSTPLLKRASTEKMSPALRALSTMGGPSSPLPATPPPNAPLPPPPAGGKTTPAHLTGSAPPSPRIGGVFTLETASPGNSPSMRPSRTGSVGRLSNSLRRERDSTSSSLSDSNGHTTATNNGSMSPAGSATSTAPSNAAPSKDNNGAISSATAQALQGVEVNELRGVVDTLAHQVQALKVEQTMQQGKIHRLEAALADAEEKLKQARSDVSITSADRDRLNRELTDLRDELMAAKVKSDKDRAGLETVLEKERREREKAVETRAIMEARMEELMGRKSKFGCF